MYNLRDELIKSVLSALRIDNNPFNSQTTKENIAHIQDRDLKKFYSSLFGTEHSYLNGMDRVKKVSQQFKKDEVNETKERAKQLIFLVESINAQVYKDSQKYKRTFSDLIDKIKLDAMIKDEDISILQLVKPYTEPKQLLSNINSYRDGNVQLQAFMDAINYFYQISNSKAIENKSLNALKIKRSKND